MGLNLGANDPSGLVRADHPHGKVLGTAAVGVPEGPAGPVDLMVAGHPPDLEGRLGEPDGPRALAAPSARSS